MNTLVELFQDLGGQLHSASNEVILFLAIIAIGYVLKYTDYVANRWIPLISFVIGIVGEILLGDPGAVSPNVRYPEARLAMIGGIIALLAWLAHATVLKRLEKKFLPESESQPVAEKKEE